MQCTVLLWLSSLTVNAMSNLGIYTGKNEIHAQVYFKLLGDAETAIYVIDCMGLLQITAET